MTRTVDLAGEFAAAREAVAHDRFFRPVEALGIDTLERPHVGAGLVRFERDGWQLDEDGTPAIVAAIRGHAIGDDMDAVDPRELVERGELLDLLAISLRPPHRWALRLGAVFFAGAAHAQLLSPSPTRWHRHPLSWLRAGDGVVALTDDAAQLARMLEQLRPGGIIVADREHGREVVATWRRVRGSDFAPPAMFIGAGQDRRAA
jgi:hypothetical protein